MTEAVKQTEREVHSHSLLMIYLCRLLLILLQAAEAVKQAESQAQEAAQIVQELSEQLDQVGVGETHTHTW